MSAVAEQQRVDKQRDQHEAGHQRSEAEDAVGLLAAGVISDRRDARVPQAA